jgi:transcriptional regulator with XRE-family HTH domain
MTPPAEPDEQRVELAARLRDAREYLGMSQDEVAAALKLSRPAITNIESGSRKVEAIELDQLAQLYGRPVTYFLAGEQADQTSSERVAFYARTLKGLSEKDLTEVARFAEFLRAGSASKKASGRNRE